MVRHLKGQIAAGRTALDLDYVITQVPGRDWLLPLRRLYRWVHMSDGISKFIRKGPQELQALRLGHRRLYLGHDAGQLVLDDPILGPTHVARTSQTWVG